MVYLLILISLMYPCRERWHMQVHWMQLQNVHVPRDDTFNEVSILDCYLMTLIWWWIGSGDNIGQSFCPRVMIIANLVVSLSEPISPWWTASAPLTDQAFSTCGAYQPAFSQVLGTSNCKKCSNTWILLMLVLWLGTTGCRISAV